MTDSAGQKLAYIYYEDAPARNVSWPAAMTTMVMRSKKRNLNTTNDGHHDTWLINRNLCDISTAELKFIEYIAPTWMGIRRVARRQLKRFAAA